MDVIIELVVFLIRALLGERDKGRAAPPKPAGANLAGASPRAQDLYQQIEHETLRKVAQMQPRRTPVARQDPAFRNSALALALTAAGVLALIAGGAAWLLYTLGLLPHG